MQRERQENQISTLKFSIPYQKHTRKRFPLKKSFITFMLSFIPRHTEQNMQSS